MNSPEVHIQSYFSLETDLAKGFSEWPEFVEGEGYDVLLKSSEGYEVVIKYKQDTEDGCEDKYISVKGKKNSALFHRALGLTIYLLSTHSDNLIVQKRT